MTFPVRRRAGWAAVPLLSFGVSLGMMPTGERAGVSPPSGPQVPREVSCVRTSGPVRVDGRADEDAWRDAVWTEAFVDIRGDTVARPPLATRARLLWDDQYLYVHADMEEPHIWATLTEHDDIVWQENDFEVFLDPDGNGLDYFEVEVNALGVVLDLFMEEPYWMGGSAELGWDSPGLQVGVGLSGTLNDPSDRDAGWSVEMAIPWADLTRQSSEAPGAPPVEGDVWRVNFSRVTWPLEVRDGGYAKANEAAAPETHPESNWVWSPQGVIDMHRPERWGRLRFVGPREGTR